MSELELLIQMRLPHFLKLKIMQIYILWIIVMIHLVADSIFKQVDSNYDAVIIGVHQFNKYPARNFGINIKCAQSY